MHYFQGSREHRLRDQRNTDPPPPPGGASIMSGTSIIAKISVSLIYDTVEHHRPLVKSTLQNNSSYFSTKTYVVGTQKNRLNETVLLSTQT